MVRIHNSQTNEIIDREMNDEEYESFLLQQKRTAEELEKQKEQEIAKNNLLTKLGITADEARLLLS